MNALRCSVIAIALTAACSAVTIRNPGGSVPSSMGRPADRGALASSGGIGNAQVKRVCRGTSETGWIAIDYVADSLPCTSLTRGTRAYRVALVIYYRDLPVGEEIAVCADERTPRDWIRDRMVPDDPRCPSDGAVDKTASPTVMIIRRLR